MKVSELIAALGSMPQDARVMVHMSVYDDSYCQCYDELKDVQQSWNLELNTTERTDRYAHPPKPDLESSDYSKCSWIKVGREQVVVISSDSEPLESPNPHIDATVAAKDGLKVS